jgi:hypothetical protein
MRKDLHAHRLAIAVLWLLLFAAIAGALGWTAIRFLPRAPLERNAEWSIAGFSLVALLLAGLATGKTAQPWSHFGAWLLVCSVISLVLSIALPGASFITTWPAICGALGMIGAAYAQQRPWMRALVLVIATLPLILLATPMVYLSFVGLRIRSAGIMLPAIVLALWGVIAPLRIIMADARRADHSAVSGGGGA